MYLVVLYIFIRWKGRVTIIVTITFLRIYANILQEIHHFMNIWTPENSVFPPKNVRKSPIFAQSEKVEYLENLDINHLGHQ